MSSLKPFVPGNDVASTLARIKEQLATATAAEARAMMAEIQACERSLELAQVKPRYRVFAKTPDGWGGHNYLAFGPLRKSLASACKSADDREGYVVNVADGSLCHQSLAYLAYLTQTAPLHSKASRQEFVEAQLFRRSS